MTYSTDTTGVENDAGARRSHLLIPGLGGLYAALAPYAVPMVRVVTGLWFVPHGLQKLFGWFGGFGLEGTTQFLAGAGYPMAGFWAVTIALLEVFGGVALAIGLLTRPVALAFAIFMAVGTLFHFANGFFWLDGGWEFPAMWFFLSAFFVIVGGGRLSVDRAIGREF